MRYAASPCAFEFEFIDTSENQPPAPFFVPQQYATPLNKLFLLGEAQVVIL